MSPLNNFFFIYLFKFVYMKEAFCLPLVNETQSVYDQRQSGKYNIHISLRDVAIIEVDKNEFSDDTISNADEYYYDDEDLTIKPISNWFSTTIQTPQLITTSFKSEGRNSQPIQDYQKVKELTSLASQRNQQPNMALLESSLGPNSSSYDAGVSLAKEPVSHIKTEASHLYVPKPSISTKQETSREYTLSEALQREQKINSEILSFISPLTTFSKGTVICRNNQRRDAYGNCKPLKRSTLLKSVFDLIKLLRIREK